MNAINSLTSSIIGLLLLITSSTQPVIQTGGQGTSQPQTQVTTANPSQVSRNWSGYTATSGRFTGVSGTWTVPQVSGNGSIGADATWVGVGGVKSDDLIQAGTQAIVDPYGQVTYSAFYEGLPDASQPLTITVHPGDSISVSLTKDAGSTWTIAVKNTTTGESTSMSVPYDSSLTSAEWIEEAPSGARRMLPLDNFGSVTISQALAIQNGKTVSASQAGATPMTMTMGGNIALAQASTLTDGGTGFTVSRTNQNISEQTIPSRGYAISGEIPFLRRRHIRIFVY